MKVEIHTTEIKDCVQIPINKFSNINGVECTFKSYDIITKMVAYNYNKENTLKKIVWFKSQLDADQSPDHTNITAWCRAYKTGSFVYSREYKISAMKTYTSKCTLFQWIRNEKKQKLDYKAIIEGE